MSAEELVEEAEEELRKARKALAELKRLRLESEEVVEQLKILRSWQKIAKRDPVGVV